ncbi:hypothetical protein GCM10025768_23320 [Microbacterium pseudoresistens]|uniref:Transcriptional regulator with XRE-family HTH domain n=1 Tax=Microbacterium pseudoresistens TaxID=640634 RepID=A0A7Y9ETE4_9MICO|nr:transcriptional regulator with XRE-family HTH domain [Microbacterium pseudoresistens]
MPRVPSPAAAHIGGRIRQAREAATLTQDGLAHVSGIDSSNIRAYESGRALPNLFTLVRIADAVGTDPGTLLAGLELEMFPVAASDARRRG